MNAQLEFNTTLLLNGIAAPATSKYVPVARAHELTFLVYASGLSGNALVTYSYPSPFFPGQDVPFYQQTISGEGYSDTLYMTTPIPNVKASVSGVGTFWVAATQQN